VTNVLITSSSFLEDLLKTSSKERAILPECIALFQKQWDAEKDRIVSAIESYATLTFADPQIEAFIVSAEIEAYSHPIVISARTDRFVELLTAMLIHTIFWKNTRGGEAGLFLPTGDNLTPESQRLVYVLAVWQAIMEETLGKPERVKEAILQAKKRPAYREPWDIVRTIGYQTLVEQLQKGAV
jgi:hypothetical protein